MGKATEDVGSRDYFKTLFGNITKGGLSLFSSKNPFYRKREQGNDVGVEGTFEQVKRKNKAEGEEDSGQVKKKLKEAGKSKNTGQETSRTEVIGDDAENLDTGSKKKKTYGKRDEHLAIEKKKKNAASGNGEFVTANNDSSGKKKEKSKDDANNGNSELASQNEENEDLRIKTNKGHSGNEEAGTSNVDHADKKKKKKCKENLNEEGLNGEGELGSLEDNWAKGNVGSSDDDLPYLSIQIQAEDDKHGLLERKGKENMLEDLARPRKEKRTKVAMEENSQSALKVQEYEVQAMPRGNHLKRKLEQENIQPIKRIKVHNQQFDEVEGGARTGSTVVTESKEKALTDFKGKSVLQKRKWDAFEEEDDARHGLGDGEYTSKEVVLPKGKRKRGEEALDMVVNKKDRDDNEKLERTVFIGNLPLGFKRKKLIREFSQFGEVESLRLRSVPIVDTKLPRKGAILKGKVNDSINSVHAYIVFKDAQSVNAALSRNMTEFSGNHIRVDRALPPRKKLKDGNHYIYDTKRTLFVGNLPFDVKDEELYQLFVGIAPMESGVEAVRVIRDPQTSMGKGIAYVLFKSMDAAKLALKKKDLKLKDRSLRLCKAQPDSNGRPQTASTSRLRSDVTPRVKALNRKRLAESKELSNTPLQKKAKTSLSYQGTKASKTDKDPIKLGSVGMHNPQANEPKPRMFKRPAVAARRDGSSQNAGQNLAGKKRKITERTGYSKSPKKIRAH
ncbi:hypothetical protein SUGI_1033100 [Cryptomeria japonica]|nr:hypothetical protein SUGI_1033100 [Cryptomeria japonica]